jgi:large subunit ribosomal protein L21
MLGEGEAVTVGAPTVDGAVVSGTLIETRKGEKVKIFKKIRRQGYRRTRGHRQAETVLRVTGITAGGKETKWDGVVSLTTKAELDARARGLDFATLNKPKKAVAAQAEAPLAKATKPAAKAKAPKAEEVEEAAAAAQVNAPVETEAKAAPKKAAPKAEGEAKKPAAKKAAAKKDDAAE